MPVVNIYIYNGKSVNTKVDESTSHKLGDKLFYKDIDSIGGIGEFSTIPPIIDNPDNEFIVVNIDRNYHIDYSTNVIINYLAKPSSRRRGELD